MRRPNPAAREGVDDDRFRSDYLRGCMAQLVGAVLITGWLIWLAM